MPKTFKTRIEAGLLGNASGTQLVQIIKDQRDAGLSQRDAYEVLDELRARMRAANDEPMEDLILGLLDLVAGYCHPSARLYEGQLRTA